MTAKDLGPCPRCGKLDEVYINRRASGRVETYFDQRGGLLETSTERLEFSMSAIVRCASCGQIRRDLVAVEDDPNNLLYVRKK